MLVQESGNPHTTLVVLAVVKNPSRVLGAKNGQHLFKIIEPEPIKIFSLNAKSFQ
ncbi:hypothetical protein THIOM_001923 [Candidatus Thiomargarita nelsonii]|uniref:Uncharacterized protein n=1 Tax=Candidatus Thiomargarita nelsonii TaxID=1003181 RepID=A0A176S2N4_9GAMM|nr:hypothetical protein THIOM_001923 [Candidatus Thiomargarita nelsonii]